MRWVRWAQPACCPLLLDVRLNQIVWQAQPPHRPSPESTHQPINPSTHQPPDLRPPPASLISADALELHRANGGSVRRCASSPERPEKAETLRFPGRPPLLTFFPPDPLRHSRLGLPRGYAKPTIPARTARSARSRAHTRPPISVHHRSGLCCRLCRLLWLLCPSNVPAPAYVVLSGIHPLSKP